MVLRSPNAVAKMEVCDIAAKHSRWTYCIDIYAKYHPYSTH